MKTQIYVLIDPDTKEVRYVGKTNNPKERLKAHLNKARDKGTHKRNWLNKLRKERKKPLFEIVDEVDIEKWKEREKHWIDHFISMGCNLVNDMSCIGNGNTKGNKTSFKKGHNAKKVVCLEKKDGSFVNSFNSIEEGEKFIGVKGITSVLANITKTAGGYIWLYEKDYYSLSDVELNTIINVANDNSNKGGGKSRFKKGHPAWNKGLNISLKPLNTVHYYLASTGKYIGSFDSALEASKALNINRESIGQCCRGKHKTAGGYIWSYNKVNVLPSIVYKGRTNNKTKNNLK